MDDRYGVAYAQLYRRHWWWRAREHFLTRLLNRYLSPGSAGEVLDFGCGDGLYFDVLARFGRPSGIEPHGEWLDPNGRWRSQISTEPLRPDPRQQGRFGLVVALDVLEHLEHPEEAAIELARRTRPGGLWVVTVPAFQSLWTAHDDLNQHFRRYRRRELVQLLEGAGLEILDAQYFFGWPAMAKLGVRAKERLLGAHPTPPRIPPAPINALCYGLSRAEQALGAVLPMPFGSSVVAVARSPVSRGARPSP